MRVITATTVIIKVIIASSFPPELRISPGCNKQPGGCPGRQVVPSTIQSPVGKSAHSSCGLYWCNCAVRGGIVSSRKAGYFSVVTLSGVACSHPMVSVTPDAICAQAFAVAVRKANSSVDPEAVRHALRPL